MYEGTPEDAAKESRDPVGPQPSGYSSRYCLRASQIPKAMLTIPSKRM